MQVIARIVCGEHLVGMRWVSCELVEVDYGVEVTWLANPFVYGYSVGLVRWRGMVVGGADVRKDRRAEDFDAVSVGAKNDLLIDADHLLDQHFVLGLRDLTLLRELAEIVHAFEHDKTTNSALRDYIAIESRESVRAESIGEQVVAANALIQD